MSLEGKNSQLIIIIEELKRFELEKIKCIEEKYCKRITELQCELECKEKECCKLSNENDILVKENEDLKWQLKDKDCKLKDANEEICQLKAEIHKLKLDIKCYGSEIEKLKRKLEVRIYTQLLSTVYFTYSIIFVTGSSWRD